MTCSPARLAANRANALKSTGPKTPEGKARSRRNGLKHGLTGAGIALPDEDQAEVDRRFAAYEAELAPTTELGHDLMLRAATLTVRLERCHRNEAARLALAVDSAARAYDLARQVEVRQLLETIDSEPGINAWRLQQSPEGVALTIEAWHDLAQDLADPARRAWGVAHNERAENLMGRRPLDLPGSRVGALSRALGFDFSRLGPEEGAGLGDLDRYEYARVRMLEFIAGRVETLTAYRNTLDLEAAARARTGAADRALFDASPEATLARKYEAAAERSLFRTLREFREVEAAAQAEAQAEAAAPEPASPTGPLASSSPGVPSPVRTPSPPPAPSETSDSKAARRRPDPEKLRKAADRRARQELRR